MKYSNTNKIVILILILIFFCMLICNKENFTGKDKSIEIVIARYNENIDWIKEDPFNKYDVTVYNKGINYEFPKSDNTRRILNIDNVGRCDHTYLYHIIQNYDNLANVTVFLPGSCQMTTKHDRAKDIIQKVEETKTTTFLDESEKGIYEDNKDFYLDSWKASDNQNTTLNNENGLTPAKYRPFGVWYKHNFGDKTVKKYSLYGIFAVKKEHILQHPKTYYENFIKELEVSSNPEVGHYFERAWAAVFDPIDT